MRLPLNATTVIFAAIVAVTLTPQLGRAQGQSQQVPMPPGGFKPPPMAPVKAYKPIAVTPPAPYNDASFVAFRKQLAEIAEKKDRAALAKLVVAQGFFWMQDKDIADKRKPGIANLASAINLDSKDDAGWAALEGYANEATAAAVPERPGLVCAPADPAIDQKAFQTLIQSTQTEAQDWGYPTKDGLEVRGAAKPDAPVTEKLGLTLVRVLPDSAPPQNPNDPAFLHVATPSGKTGFVPMEAVSSIGGDEMCYTKGTSGWMITGYFGGVSQ
jgi:hypothetical protein